MLDLYTVFNGSVRSGLSVGSLSVVVPLAHSILDRAANTSSRSEMSLHWDADRLRGTLEGGRSMGVRGFVANSGVGVGLIDILASSDEEGWAV